MASTKRPAFETISVADVVKSPRGRQAELDDVLLDAFATITDDETALRLNGYDSVSLGIGPDGKDNRAKVSNVIRKNWDHVDGQMYKSKVNFATDGTPQVQRGKLIAEATADATA